MKYTGVCLGATTISAVTVQQDETGIKIIDASSYPHEGEPRRVLLKMLADQSEARICATGRKFRHVVKLPSISEPEAVERAYAFCCREQHYEGIVSAGGETFIYYELDPRGIIGNVFTGSKCASGTGEFFLQQIKRINLTPEQAMQAARDAAPYPVAGRCSVFCKSDCTHALNKGENKGRVVAGLCQMMAGKILELVRQTSAQKILLVGGTAQNTVMVQHLQASDSLHVDVPEEAPYFEALGAALWACENQVEPVEVTEANLFKPFKGSFYFFPPLDLASEQVKFENITRSQAREGDRLLLGLDVGSTTTKAVLIREADHALVASTYLRTNGDPVQASRNCYRELARQVPDDVEIFALGVTGSGREIAALHALTPGVINEIIAHATAALYFDAEVDTIFEIGGQDAKYTYIVNGVPADYAMNEACSAGTGSFLEEAAQESLEVSMTEIAPLALQATFPPDFNDQCAAFIGSDIKTAVQEGINTNDILAGLVYSICQNYLTRVKGSRPVGQKVFMQGGVCYNHAVPVAMAALLEKPIVVPPEPGLMGAFGVALEVQAKIKDGFIPEKQYHLAELARREITYERSFICKGSDNCDRKCPVKVLSINGKRYPFGGACSKYSNARKTGVSQVQGRDYVFEREKLLFAQQPPDQAKPSRGKTVGINRSLLTHTFYPLYHHFFSTLGFELVVPSEKDPAAIIRQGASFCYPVELSHSFFAGLLKEHPDYIFLPQVRGLPVTDQSKVGTICPLAQAEPYYLKAAFPELYENKNVLTPVLDFSRGFQAALQPFVQLGKSLGATAAAAKEAYLGAVSRQERFIAELKERGNHLLAGLQANPEKKAIVLFGRAYNAFTAAANLGISQKFASRGLDIIPCDFLPYEGEESFHNMYWASGQMNIQAARLVQRHPQLFGVFISNFSCGPDSFIVGYFREIMGNKPSLTLELDSHSSDAGLDTRIDAFLDIIEGYLKTQDVSTGRASRGKVPRPRAILEKGAIYLQLPSGEKRPLDHPKVKLLLPSMGKESTSLMASSIQYKGIQAITVPEPGEKELTLGQGHSNCKECLPLQLTVGSLLRYLEEHPLEPDENMIYFMPDTSGPCRFGQYQVFINQLLNRLEIPNVTTLSLSSDNSYGGLGTDFTVRAWTALITADVLSEVYSTLLTLARDRTEALAVYQEVYQELLFSFAHHGKKEIYKTLEAAAFRLGQIPLINSPDDTPKIALLGEIYVRSDSFSRQNLVEYFADHGIIARVAPISEWLYYTDYLLQNNLLQNYTRMAQLKNRLQQPVKRRIEKRIKKIFAQTDLYEYHLVRVDHLMDVGSNYMMPQLTGEAILTLSCAIAEIVDQVSGAVALGPFGCMPNRIAEAITSKAFTERRLYRSNGRELPPAILEEQPHLPFMAIETDGSVFPQVVEARLESFILQVKRLHQLVKQVETKVRV